VDVKKFLDENYTKFSVSGQDLLNSYLAIYAIRRDEPGFLLRKYQIEDSFAWVISFDDNPGFWLKMCNSRSAALEFCQRYQLRISRIDEEYHH
jgi:hypothetical protein